VLIPAAVGGSALLGAAVSWLVGGAPGDGDALVLRVLVLVAAFAAVTGAALLRRWDLEAARQVARERAAKAGLTWQVEERQAELEEAQELIATLEAKVRDKRAELGRLRSEHAGLLRRYATAESERAKALEGRRRLALEAAAPAKAITAEAADHRTPHGAPTRLTYLQAYEALGRLSRSAARPPAAAPADRPPQVPEQARQRGGGGFDFFGTGSPERKKPRPERATGTGGR
jgi:hypothetical protein